MLKRNGVNDDEAETFENLAKRVKGVLDNYIEQKSCNNIIMVSHGATINSLLAALSNHVIGTGKTKLKNACTRLFNIY